IAKKAGLQIKSGEIIVMDGGRRRGGIGQYVNDISERRIVRNCVKIGDELNGGIEEEGIEAEVIMVGGKRNSEEDVVGGDMRNELLEGFKFDKGFI
ncbi:sugar phosphate isomerase family, partial [Staphylococcus epidermidis]